MENTHAAGRITSRFDRDSTALDVVEGLDLSGRIAIVTGGASGIGVETARALASAGAAVVIAARQPAAAAEVAARINEELGAERVRVEELDLADLASVRAFAARWGDRPLHYLINNAGVMACPLSRTRDGFEMQFGTNHLGHFLLSELLVPALAAADGARVVSLSSTGHVFADIDFDDPNYERRAYRPFDAYGQSKTANALFAIAFDRRYRERGIRAFAVMPGVIKSNLGRHMTPEMRADLGLGKPVSADKAADKPPRLFFQEANVGAATSLWAATGAELDGCGGLYLEECAQAVPYDGAVPPRRGVAAFAIDPVSADRLWTLSAELVGLDTTDQD